MKIIFPCLLALLWAAPAFSQKKSQSSSKEKSDVVELADALRRNLVALTVKGFGGHQGVSLEVTCRSLTGKALKVRIEQGQMMEPADPGEQTLLVAHSQTLNVEAKTPAAAKLRTFCAQAGDRSPLAGASFALGALAPENLRTLLRQIAAQGKLDDPDAQQAVWCMTDGHSLAGIGDPELQRITAKLVGKNPPGYRVKYHTVETPGEAALPGKALVVESQFRYVLEKDEKTSLLLLDAAGTVVKTVSKDKKDIAGEHRSGLRLEVHNLPPGNYTVRLQTSAGKVLQDLAVEL
jgi:hypothetical protein